MRLLNPIGLALLVMAQSATGTVAKADVVTVVSAKSAITSLSKNQAADIFLGRTNHFPNGAQAVPVDLPEGSAVRDEFYEKVAGKSPSQLKAHWSKIIFTGRGQPPKTVADAAELKKMLAANLSAIGYIDETQVDPSVRVVGTP